MRIFVNGLGRIGRSVLRAWASPGARDCWPGLQIVGVNDLAPADMCAYLLGHDSVFGPWPEPVAAEDGILSMGERRLSIHCEKDARRLPLHGVDLVMDCTGAAQTRRDPEALLEAGARRVLVSGPFPEADATVVLGANDTILRPEHSIVSNASCTTNALAPLAHLLDSRFGIEAGWMTTIHCYTGSQPTVDKWRGDAARSRAAALSMVPTTTSASRLLDQVLPELAGRIEGAAVRVPVASVSAVDFTFRPGGPVDAETLNAALSDAGGVIGTTHLPLVSSDLCQRPESVIMALPETRVTAAGLARVFGWYDNEWGFSNRMLDIALRIDAFGR
ncbi:MAG: aldehyde dehydrogenase [Rhodobacteraceae bacterium]|nr:aldehyde dehydrogenase [Paracoccaceae bacterium]